MNKFEHDAMDLALQETGIIYYGIGKELIYDNDLFSKWVALQYPHVDNLDKVSDLARAYVAMGYTYYAPEIINLDKKTVRFMKRAVSDNKTRNSQEGRLILTEQMSQKDITFINKYIDYLEERLALLKFDEAPKATSLYSGGMDFYRLLAGISQLAYYTGYKDIPDSIISLDKEYKGYDALFLYILSTEKQYSNFNDQITPMLQFVDCLSKIDRVISEIMINEYIDRPVYTRSAYLEYHEGKRFAYRQSDIEKQMSKRQAESAVKLIMSVCRKPVDNAIFY